MQVFIAVSCFLAVASAGYLGPHAVGLHYAQHAPVIGPHGVPLEPAENVAARAQHAAAHVEAKARNGDVALIAGHGLGYAGHGIAVASPLAYSHGAYLAAPQHLPVIGAHGVPLEPAANVAARAQHAAAHIEAKARNGDLAYAVGHGYAAAPLAYSHGLAHAYAAPAYGYAVHPAHTYPALAHDGQPLETPEVVAAKAHHFAAHAEANSRVHGGFYAAPYAAYAGHYAHGVPLDTAEVHAAKVAHFAAHAAAAHGHHY